MPQNFDLTFVKDFNYPKQVKDHFQEILSHIDESKVESVILTGSTSRGELSYKVNNESLSIYSDYEFLIVAKGQVDHSDLKRLSNIYAKLETEITNIPLFHIDFSYVNKKLLTNLPFHIKHFEMRETGRTIFGSDLLQSVRQVNINNLDFKDLNEILIWRLWQILLYTPTQFLDFDNPHLNLNQENIFKYVICRNFLDLVTWRLPFNEKLIAGFHNRAKYLLSNPPKQFVNAVIDEGFMLLLNEAMAGKFEIKFTREIKLLYTDMLAYFIRAKDDLEKMPFHKAPYAKKLKRNLFHDYNHRRKAREIIFVSKNLKQTSPWRGVRWILTKKFKLMLDFLCVMHEAVISHINGNKIQAKQQLNLAESYLCKLNLNFKTTSTEKKIF